MMIKTTKEILEGNSEFCSFCERFGFEVEIPKSKNKLWVDCESAEKTLQSRLAKASQQEIKFLEELGYDVESECSIYLLSKQIQNRIKQLEVKE